LDELITDIWSSGPLLDVKIIHLVDRTDLSKISNFVYGGKGNCNKLREDRGRERVYGGYSELAGSPFVSVKINGLETFWSI